MLEILHDLVSYNAIIPMVPGTWGLAGFLLSIVQSSSANVAIEDSGLGFRG